MNTRGVFFVPVFLLPFVLAADATDPPLKNAAALAAIRQCDMATVRAKAEYARVVGAATKQLIADLDQAEKNAVKGSSLDDALSIRSAKKEVQDRLVLTADFGFPESVANEITGTD